MTKWITVSERTFSIDGAGFIPSWPKTDLLLTSMDMVEDGEGFIATKRIAEGNVIIERLVYCDKRSHQV